MTTYVSTYFNHQTNILYIHSPEGLLGTLY